MDLEIIQLINFQQCFSVHCVLQWECRLFHLKRTQRERVFRAKEAYHTRKVSSFQIISEQET